MASTGGASVFGGPQGTSSDPVAICACSVYPTAAPGQTFFYVFMFYVFFIVLLFSVFFFFISYLTLRFFMFYFYLENRFFMILYFKILNKKMRNY